MFFMILGGEVFFKFENQYLGIVLSFLEEYSPLHSKLHQYPQQLFSFKSFLHRLFNQFLLLFKCQTDSNRSRHLTVSLASDQLHLISDAILSPHGIIFVMIYLTWRRFCYEFTSHGVVLLWFCHFPTYFFQKMPKFA